jgi:hypothetical protein
MYKLSYGVTYHAPVVPITDQDAEENLRKNGRMSARKSRYVKPYGSHSSPNDKASIFQEDEVSAPPDLRQTTRKFGTGPRTSMFGQSAGRGNDHVLAEAPGATPYDTVRSWAACFHIFGDAIVEAADTIQSGGVDRRARRRYLT